MTTSCTPIPQDNDAPTSCCQPADVTVWWWDIPTGTYDPADLPLLDGAERERLQRLRTPESKAIYVTCRAAVRRILSGALQVAPEELEFGRLPCPGCASPEHGPPTVLRPATDLRISITHTTGLGMLAVAPVPVGVDAEGAKNLDVEELARPTLTPEERQYVLSRPPGEERTRAFLRCWTRKEAVLKAVGIGITVELNTLETGPASEGPVTVAAGVEGGPAEWAVRQIPAPEGWSAALALPAGTRPNLRVRKWPTG
ncbi:4'-phosphopantetheinyl transferase family protein [Streptomyces sp. NPDC050504]|uniref:4'-phosphopantetheinyl transferase family protein n=1 Tax=Streptomyces sp. NPDC050504 TaxID=3365618 RepID=UPI00378A3E93